MAQKLNMTKEQLEQYKEKFSRIQDMNDSLTTTTSNGGRRSSIYLANFNASNGN